MRAKGLIRHDREHLAAFITLYDIPFSNCSAAPSTKNSYAWDKMGETQSICRLPQNVSHLEKENEYCFIVHVSMMVG